MLPLLLSAQSSMLNRTFYSEKTFIPQDECSQFFDKYESIAELNLQWFRTGRSLGIHAMLLGQDLEPFINSQAGKSLLTLCPTYIVGFIESSAIPLLRDRGIPEHLLRQCAKDAFIPDRQKAARRWLVHQKDRDFFGDHYVSHASLALTMNSQKQKRLKTEFKEQFPNKFQFCSELATHLENGCIDNQVL